MGDPHLETSTLKETHTHTEAHILRETYTVRERPRHCETHALRVSHTLRERHKRCETHTLRQTHIKADIWRERPTWTETGKKHTEINTH